MLSAIRGHEAIVQALLAAGSDVHAIDRVRRNDVLRCSISLLIVFVLSMQSSNTALMLAAQNGHKTIVQALMAAGSDVHAKGEVRM